MFPFPGSVGFWTVMLIIILNDYKTETVEF